MLTKGTFYYGLAFMALMAGWLGGWGCISKIKLDTDHRDPLQELLIAGQEEGKVAVIPVVGFISDIPRVSLIRSQPSLVQEVVAQLQLAEEDEEVKTVLLQVNSPGGTSTGSDILYHEILEFKKRTGKKVVVAMVDVAASGGYYLALPADYIFAHPTSVTGSVGAIFIRPKLVGLMGKIGVEVKVSKSGKDKDLGAFYQPVTEEETRLFDELIQEMGGIFLDLVKKHRKLSADQVQKIASARVFMAPEALKNGLIDEIGYLDQALAKAKKLAGLDKDAKVVAYRRSYYPNDNIYNVSNNRIQPDRLLELGLFNDLTALQPGFYYLWAPGLSN